MVEKIYASKPIQDYIIKEMQLSKNGGQWGLIDPKCIFPGAISNFSKQSKIQERLPKYRAVVKNKTDSTILIKAEGPTKAISEKEAMKICIGKSIQSTFKEGCYLHYVGKLGNF